MYRTIRMILRYDMIHIIHILYRTIHEHLRYTDMIRNFFHMIRYVSYDTYRVSLDTDNYAPNNGKQVANYVLEMLVKHVGDVHCEIMQINTSNDHDVYLNIDRGNHCCNIFSIRQRQSAVSGYGCLVNIHASNPMEYGWL